jgi:protein-L-isoaspartate(D-aspartate) O-methyltransferase
MIEVLRASAVRPVRRVLEIGTGCGYQAAVLAHVFPEVYSLERIEPLYERARTKLRDLKIENVYVRYADGSAGFPEAAPFDGIIMAAAAPVMSVALREQLLVGGRMVLPVGRQEQWLYLVEREAQGFRESRLESVKFVPLLMGKA